MFTDGFKKLAVAVVTMTPEEYFDTVGAKDPLVGAIAGSIAGTAAGLYKGKKGKKAVSALAGHLAGSGAGAGLGHVVGKAWRGHQARKVHHLSEDLRLRSTPSRASYMHQED